jgi:hypothetical protein
LLKIADPGIEIVAVASPIIVAEVIATKTWIHEQVHQQVEPTIDDVAGPVPVIGTQIDG